MLSDHSSGWTHNFSLATPHAQCSGLSILFVRSGVLGLFLDARRILELGSYSSWNTHCSKLANVQSARLFQGISYIL